MPKRVPSVLRRASAESRAVAGQELWLPPPTLAGVTVTPDSALGLTAAYAAINVLATDVASLDFGAYRLRPDGSKEPAPDLPQHDLCHFSPDEETTSVRFRQAQMGHVLGWGNSYAEIRRRGNGRPFSLHLLDPATTRPKRADDGSLWYDLGNGKSLPASNVLHVAGLGFDGLCGYSPIRMARQAIALGLAAEAFGSTWFGKRARPRGMIRHPGKLSAAAAKNLRESIEAVHQGPAHANRLAVLEEGMDWVQTTVNPEDAQFLATRTFQVIEIARIYRVPPHKVGDYTHSHLANIEEANLDYLITSLMGWLVAIEQEYNLKLFTRAERKACSLSHDVNSLLRGNVAARGVFYEKLFAMGALSPNAILRLENMNPLTPEEGGDKRFVPLNFGTLEGAGNPEAAPVDGPPANPKAKAGPGDVGTPPAAAPAPAPAMPPGSDPIFDLKRLLNDAATYELPAETVKAAVLASFPFDEGQVDAMLAPLAGFTPKSMAKTA